MANVLFGLLVQGQAKPQGYNYPQPQQPQQLQLSQSHSSSASFQQNPQLNHISAQAPPQQLPPQINQYSNLQYNLPNLPAPAVSQVSIAQHQNNNGGDYENSLYRQQDPQVNLIQNQANLPAPQQISLSHNEHLQAPPQQQIIGLGQRQQSVSYQQNLPQLVQLPLQQQAQLINLQYPHQGTNLDISQFQQPHQNFQIQPNTQNIQTTFSQQLPENLVLQQPQIYTQSIGYPSQASSALVTKHVYVHVAPDEPDLPQPIIPAPLPPRKTYRIIFIKAPSQGTNQRQIIHVPAPQQTVEEKTLVYVLVNKPQQPEIVVSTPAPAPLSKPEVYFIKYKPNLGGAAVPVADSQPIVEDLKREQQNQGQPINSGESTSSLFSGGLPSAKYGPPGYQKRNARNNTT